MGWWTSYAGWMQWHLDVSEGVTQAFAIAYRVTDDGAEAWTARLNRFKSKDRAAFAGAIGTMKDAIPQLFSSLKLDMVRTLFVPALSSGETKAAPTGQLPVLARKCADWVGAQFSSDVLSKQPHNPIHGIYTAAGRSAELDKAAYVAQPVKAKNVFVFDDFYTRGDTLSRVAQAILASSPGVSVYGIALGKTDRRSYSGGISNDHVPPRWAELWEQGEQRYKDKNKG